jgi:hypothetical protein
LGDDNNDELGPIPFAVADSLPCFALRRVTLVEAVAVADFAYSWTIIIIE